MSPEDIAAVFAHEDGKLLWKPRPKDSFKDERTWKIWTTKFAGKVAGALSGHGYVKVWFGGKSEYAHRLIFILVNGPIPDGALIDHIDRNGLNNRPENLRLANKSENARNRSGPMFGNTSGIRGVHWNRDRKKWHVQVTEGGRRRYLGLFDSLDEAKVVSESAIARNYGAFSGKVAA